MRRAGPVALVVVGLAAATACDRTVYDALGVPREGPLVCAEPGTHACFALDVCARDDDATRCEADCHPCTTSVPGAKAICLRNVCGYECPAGQLRCETGCCGAEAITAGDYHTCAVTAGTRELLCWGANNDGQLGNGYADGADQPTPMKVPLPGPVLEASAGNAHSCAALEDGSVWCWGRASSFATGSEYVYAPQVVPRLSGAISIAAGGGHTCAIRAGGEVRCTGAWTPVATSDTAIPSGATEVASGDDFSCAIVAGQVLCWGPNDWNELGAPGVIDKQPVVVALPGPVSTIALGFEYACAAIASSAAPVHCWGTPLGVVNAPPTPWAIDAVTYVPAALAAGGAHTCALAARNVECWGATAADVVLGGTPSGAGAPVHVMTGAVAVDAGLTHTCAIDEASGVVCWGSGGRGQLGDGARTDSAEPVRVVSR